MFLLAALVGWIGFLWQARTLPKMAAESSARLGTLLGLLGRREVLTGLAGLLLTLGGGRALFTSRRPLMEQGAHMSVGVISAASFAVGLASLAGSNLSGRLLSSNRRATHILSPLLLSGVVLGFALPGHRAAGVIVMLVLWGLPSALLPVGWSTWIAHTVPDVVESAGGLRVATVQGGVTLGAALGGVALDHLGMTGVLTGSGLTRLLGALVILLGLGERHRGDAV